MFHCRGKDDNRRQRTKSGSSASSNDKVAPRDDEVGVEEADATLSPSAKNIRGAAARNHRKKELREQEEKREKDRGDATGRRKGRAEKRRGDGRTRTHHLSIPVHQLILMIRIRSIRRTPISQHFLQKRQPGPNSCNTTCNPNHTTLPKGRIPL